MGKVVSKIIDKVDDYKLEKYRKVRHDTRIKLLEQYKRDPSKLTQDERNSSTIWVIEQLVSETRFEIEVLKGTITILSTIMLTLIIRIITLLGN